MFSRLGPCVTAVQGLTVRFRTTRWSVGGSDCVWIVPSEILRQLNFAPPHGESSIRAGRAIHEQPVPA